MNLPDGWSPTDAAPVPEPLRRREVAGIFLVVLVAHLLLAAMVSLPGSFGKYPMAARQLASGEMARERLLDFSPLYLELHRGLRHCEALLGPLEKFFPYLQIALLAWAVAATAAVSSRHLGRRAAFVFAALLAFDRHLLIYVRVLEPEIVLLALLATWLFFLDREEGRTPQLLLAGAAAAGAIATRPTFLPVFLLVAPLYLGLRQGFRPWRAWLRSAALFLLPLLLVSGALAWRAFAASGDFRAPAMNPGTVFFEGHQPLSTGTSARYPPAVHLAMRGEPDTQPDVAHVWYRRIAREDRAEPGLAIARVNDFWASRAIAFVKDQPRLAVERALTQLRYSLHAYTFHDVPMAMLYQQRLGSLFVPFSLLAALAVWGAFAALAQARSLLLFYAIFAAQLGVMTLFYVSGRQRLVLLPAVVFFALLGVADLRARGRRGLLLGLLLALLALAFSLRDAVQNEDLYLGGAFSASLAYREEITTRLAAGATMASLREPICASLAEVPSRLEDTRPADYPQEAESLEDCLARQLRQQLEVAPSWQRESREFDLAGVELLRGNLDAAAALLEPLAELGRRFQRDGAEASSPRYFLARIAYLRGDASTARGLLETALAEAPGEPFVLADLGALTGERRYEEQLLRYYSRLDAAWLRGRALLFYRQPESARQALAAVVERLPAARRPRLELAIALAELGRDDEAFTHLQQAYQGPGEPCAQAARVLPLLERLAQQKTLTRERIELGILFFHHGAYRRAAELLGPALAELGPAAPPALVKLLEEARKG